VPHILVSHEPFLDFGESHASPSGQRNMKTSLSYPVAQAPPPVCSGTTRPAAYAGGHKTSANLPKTKHGERLHSANALLFAAHQLEFEFQKPATAGGGCATSLFNVTLCLLCAAALNSNYGASSEMAFEMR
jgi:hypothetical protein